MESNTSTGPKSIGIILDGNRRWAKEQGLPAFEGHRIGYEKVREVMGWAKDVGISEMIFYVFSTENWKRSEEEVAHLMKLLDESFESWMKDIAKEDVQIRFIGDRAPLSESIQRKMKEMESQTKNGTKGTVAFALSYGGRGEILAAVNKLIAEGKTGPVTEEEFVANMWSAGLLYPDLIIRTGGNMRLSNFLTWQSTYSELFFSETKWPAFTKEEFDSVIAEFSQCERRHGK